MARRLLIKLACRLSDYFLAVTPTVAEEMHSFSGIPKRKIAVLPSSVDVDRVLASRNTPVTHQAFIREGMPVIITAGRLSPQKRLDVLLEAASSLTSRIEFNLVILGEGALREDLEQLASTLGIKDRTFFLGFVPNPWPYISRASVFALSSDYEGLPCVLIEAMACGVPVVATQAAAEYVISNEENGLLVPQRDPEALSEAVWRLLVDRELRQRCIESGLKRASDFRVETVAQLFCLALENLVQEKNRGSA
jgi:glycosyltransferase involved in cell wall biosynthesis